MTSKLWNKNFYLLWQGQSVSQLGTQAFVLAMTLWLKDITHSGKYVGGLLFALFLPWTIFGFLGGIVSDRISRKKILVTCDLINGTLVMTLASLMFLIPTRTEILIPALYIVAMIVGTISAFCRPTFRACVPDLVPPHKLEHANSFTDGALFIGQATAQALGGIIYALFGAPLLFLFDGGSYFFSSSLESRVQFPHVEKRPFVLKKLFREVVIDTKEAYHFIRSRLGMIEFFILLAFINFFYSTIFVLLAFYVEETLHRGPEWFGFVIAAQALGLLIGMFFTKHFFDALHFTITTRWRVSLIVFASTLIGIGIFHHAWIVFFLLLGNGLFDGYLHISSITSLQKSIPSKLRGRVMGLFLTIVVSAVPLGYGISGLLLDLVNKNAPLLFLMNGSILLILSLILISRKGIQKYLHENHQTTSLNL